MNNSNTGDLWVAIPEISESIPKQLMKEQAAYLAKKTKGLVTAEVTTHTYFEDNEEIIYNSKSKKSKVIQSFYLVVPNLKYRYELFSIIHGIKVYPTKFVYEYEEQGGEDGKLREAKNEKEFIENMSKILGSENTGKILSSLLAQAKS
jgi:choline kinase